MGYCNIRQRVNKFYKGGSIRMMQAGGSMTPEEKAQLEQIRQLMQAAGGGANGFNSLDDATNQLYHNLTEKEGEDMEAEFNAQQDIASTLQAATAAATALTDAMKQSMADALQLKKDASLTKIAGMTGVNTDYVGEGKGLMNATGAAVTGVAATAGVKAMEAVDNMAMGDKNFGAQSQAIDSAVHSASSALMKSGNPYAMAAGAALEGANFLTKAGGLTVQGFDVDINSSGYGNLGHMESSSSRDFGAMIGLGGLNKGAMEAKLAKRNAQARMALTAAEIVDDVNFQQEARATSIDNVLRNNQIALAGGVDTSLLGS